MEEQEELTDLTLIMTIETETKRSNDYSKELCGHKNLGETIKTSNGAEHAV